MDVKYIIDRIGDSQGWDDQSKIHLLCRYIEYRSSFAHGGTEIMDLASWLENQADWENEEGLDAGRSP